MKYFLGLIGVVLFAVIVAASLQKDAATPPQSYHVAATIFPLYDIVKNIAGDDVSVTLILPPGANPHIFEPTPSLAAALQNVATIYTIGHGIDDWANHLSPAGVTTVEANVPLRTQEGIVDPHYWLTVPNAKIIATNVANDLALRFPDKSNVFSSNLATYMIALDEADTAVRNALADAKRDIVTMHDAWYYFADAYDLRVIGTFEPSNGEEPTPRHLAFLAHRMEAAGITTIFVDAGESEAALAAFAEGNDVTIRTVDAEGVANPGSYIDLIISNAQAFSTNQ